VTPPEPPNIHIAMCETVAECHACEDLQLAVWGGTEREVTPYDILRAIVHAGGTVLGAWHGGRIVGMALSIVAWGAGGAYHHSHLLGVLPEYRRWGVGRRLKMAQRDFVLAQGLDLITWTFDPLESANAHLNVAKLGAISTTYLPDFYGAMPEELNAGLPSDRLLVEWHLRAPHVLGRLATATGGSALPLVSAESFAAPYLLRMGNDGLPEMAPSPVRGRGEFNRAIAGNALTRSLSNETPLSRTAGEGATARLRIEIPADIQRIKATDPARARSWRMATRAAFTSAFAASYRVTDYRAPRFHRHNCGCYLLSEQTAGNEQQAVGGNPKPVSR
jgi:predicted GNAT superfamily acetyltransferase